ncbi:MAG: hypothetical protein RR202_04450 [Bacteroidales bacterium]
MSQYLKLLLLIWCLTSCTPDPRDVEEIQQYPALFPDYAGVTIPCNIAPLNFRIPGTSQAIAEFGTDETTLFRVAGKSHFNIPLNKWKALLQQAKGKKISVRITAQHPGESKWRRYLSFDISVSSDSIDSHIAYRLIEPGYERWGKMGIYQRDLASFKEDAIIENDLLDKGCVNCHSFHNYSPQRWMFHLRKSGGGTVIQRDGKIEKMNLKTKKSIGNGTYPMWHPSGRYIILSDNTTRQAFHAFQEKKIEVYDLESDLILYDVEQQKVHTDPRFNQKDQWETFPAWSPDGKWLYFCRSGAREMPFEVEKARYSIYRIGFDAETGQFGKSTELILDGDSIRKSASFPRLSPDGRYLLYTLSDYGTFPIWHKEADLHMIDTQSMEPVDVSSLNSDDVESYHSWSSSGRWVIFSSRRFDGRYTRLFIAYFDKAGKMHKPFLLPQKDPEQNTLFLKSYNIPEFIKGKVEMKEYELAASINDLSPKQAD